MDLSLFKQTKNASYFIWEITRSEKALGVWTCAEDISVFFAQSGLLKPSDVEEILRRGKNDFSYIHLIRHVAYRLYVHTGESKTPKNWYDAERLVCSKEWIESTTAMATLCSAAMERSDKHLSEENLIINYYKNIQL
ncbi:MAG: hypothetical protein LBM16_03550 [Clostridiales bacterium]|jgi:hypothetical protein|nr:hypothetical protein [Clostridiales bacterium]